MIGRVIRDRGGEGMTDEQNIGKKRQDIESQVAEAAEAVAVADAAAPVQDTDNEFIRQIKEKIRLQREQTQWHDEPDGLLLPPPIIDEHFSKKIAATVGIMLLVGLVVVGSTYLALEKMLPRRNPVTAEEKLEARGIPFTVKGYFEQIGQGDQAAVELFLAAGFSVDDRRAVDEYTPLMLAAQYGDGSLADLLLQRGADVNARDKNGQTALMKAAAQGHDRLAEKLLAAGADWRIKDENGETALNIAKRKKEYVIEKYLEARAALEPETQGERRRQDQALLAGKQQSGVNGSDGLALTGFSLRVGQAGPFFVGMPLDRIPRDLPVTRIRQNYNITTIFYDRVEPVVVLSHSQGASNAVANIIVYDPRFKTDKGIGVNSSLGELRRAYPSLAIGYDSGGCMAADAPEISMHFELDTDSADPGKSKLIQPMALPDDIRVTRILVF